MVLRRVPLYVKRGALLGMLAMDVPAGMADGWAALGSAASRAAHATPTRGRSEVVVSRNATGYCLLAKQADRQPLGGGW
jgi:hypothetical protein